MLTVARSLCPYCGDSSHIYRSKVKTWFDLTAIFLLLRPVRCHSCLSRFYRPRFVRTPPPPPLKRTAETLEDERRSA